MSPPAASAPTPLDIRCNQPAGPGIALQKRHVPRPAAERLETDGPRSRISVEHARAFDSPRGDVEQRLAPRVFHERVIAQKITDPQGRNARLPGAEEVAGTAQLEVALGNDEPVSGVGGRLYAARCLCGEGAV